MAWLYSNRVPSRQKMTSNGALRFAVATHDEHAGDNFELFFRLVLSC